MDDYCSPQWVDFTSTPKIPTDDYFEKNHKIYEHNKCVQVQNIKMASEDKENIEEISEVRINDEKLKTELNIIKNTPIKVIYSPASLRNSKKCKLTEKMTCGDIVHEAIEAFENCTSTKLDIFKKPMRIKNEVSKSLKFHDVDNTPVNVLRIIKAQQVTDDKHDQEIESLPSTSSCNPDILAHNTLKNNECNLKSDINNPVVYTPINSMKSLRINIPNKQEQYLSLDKTSSNKQSKPVTYLCRRQSLNFRRRSGPYISLAAAVHKFQNDTPERFHTKCNKNLKVKAASAKRNSFVARKSVFAKYSMKRRSVPALRQKEEENLKLDNVKKLPFYKIPSQSATEASEAITSRRSLLNPSKKNTVRNKHVSTIVNNNGSEIVVRKEKILFFDIPILTKPKAPTRPVPFSFEHRDKAKKESKSQKLELKDDKLVNNVKPQNIQTRILQKKINTGSIGTQNKAPPSINDKSNHSNQLKTNGEACKLLRTSSLNPLKSSNEKNKNNKKNVINTSENLKATTKINKSRSMSSLKSSEKTEYKNEKTEHSHSKDIEQVKKQSKSITFKNSLVKHQEINKNKNTTYNVQTEDINPVNKQSSLLLCKEKSKSINKKSETIQTKEDPNKIEKKCSTSNSINTNTDIQENKCPNVNPSTSSNKLNLSKNMKSKNSTLGMNSYERGKQRHEYDEKIRQKIKMEQEMHKKMEADKLAQEKVQIAIFRKQLEVKARPVPVSIYKPLIPIKSIKPLTEPQSPAWGFRNKTKKNT